MGEADDYRYLFRSYKNLSGTRRIIGADGNSTDPLLFSCGSDDVPPYVLRSEAGSQLHLCGPTLLISAEFLPYAGL